MINLFIVGNGFDVYHNFRTKYSDFKNYIENEYKIDDKAAEDNDMKFYPDYDTNFKQYECYDPNKWAAFFYDLICYANEDDLYWNEFETSLGKLDTDNYNGSMPVKDAFFLLKKKYFIDWANSIDTSHPSPISEKVKETIGKAKQNFYLNFNYTDTLEKHYGAKDVCHIHGDINYFIHNNMDRDIVIGHVAGKCPYSDEDNEFVYEVYTKKTDKIISEHSSFFKSLNKVTDIYIIGFSLSEVDMPYIKEVYKAISDKKNAKIHLATRKDGNPQKRAEKIDNLREVGFENIIDFEL